MSRVTAWMWLVVLCVVSVVAVWVVAGRDVIYANYDGPFYIVVAKVGYNFGLIRSTFSFPLPVEYYAAHLPGYPLLIRLVASTGINYLDSMLLANVLATIVGAGVLYEINKHYKWFATPLLLPVLWLFVWPRMWAVRAVGSPESLFIVLCVVSLWMFDRKKYWLAGLAGAGAVLTKSPGVLLLVTYGMWFAVEVIKRKKWHVEIWPVLLIAVAGWGLFGWYQYQTGDFWAYFHSGDNIHLQVTPFGVFNADLFWVQSFWLEDIIWLYAIGAIGIWYALKRAPVFGLFGLVYYLAILLVAHRDVARYSLPIVPTVLVGLAPILERKEVKVILALMLIPMYFYTVNFVSHNFEPIANWGPLM